MLEKPNDPGRVARWLFDQVHRRHLVYNQCWEDPAVDGKALALTPEDRVLVITSAGCNALDYALSGARVLAVDVNPRQNHLLELKRAGIRTLEWDAFFELFGRGGSRRTREAYAVLRTALPVASREHWDREIRLFEPDPARGRSFYYRGSSGLVALALTRWIRHGARLAAPVERLLAAAVHARRAARDLPRRAARAAAGRAAAAPRRQSLGDVAPRRARAPAPHGARASRRDRGIPARLPGPRDAGGAAARQLLLERLPPGPLHAGTAARATSSARASQGSKAGLVDNVSTFTGTVTQFLAREQEPISAFVLLDHMDLARLARGPAGGGVGRDLPQAGWSARSSRSGGRAERFLPVSGPSPAPGARVIFRSGGCDERFLPVSVLRRLRFERERAAAPPPARSRRNLWLLPHPPASYRPSEPLDRFGLAALDGFYRLHAPVYDSGTRPLLLRGRREAVHALALRPGELVLDVGCGTGFSLPRLLARGARVVGIEPSTPMRRQAERRLERRVLGHHVVELDPAPIRQPRRLRRPRPRRALLLLAVDDPALRRGAGAGTRGLCDPAVALPSSIFSRPGPGRPRAAPEPRRARPRAPAGARAGLPVPSPRAPLDGSLAWRYFLFAAERPLSRYCGRLPSAQSPAITVNAATSPTTIRSRRCARERDPAHVHAEEAADHAERRPSLSEPVAGKRVLQRFAARLSAGRGTAAGRGSG